MFNRKKRVLLLFGTTFLFMIYREGRVRMLGTILLTSLRRLQSSQTHRYNVYKMAKAGTLLWRKHKA